MAPLAAGRNSAPPKSQGRKHQGRLTGCPGSVSVVYLSSVYLKHEVVCVNAGAFGTLAAKAARQHHQVLEAMKENYVASLKDRPWNVPFQEYKLFILRHSEFKDKVSEMQNRAFATTIAALDAIYNSVEIALPVSTLAAATGLGALANTLGIALLSGEAITQEEVDAILGLFSEALTSRRPGGNS